MTKIVIAPYQGLILIALGVLSGIIPLYAIGSNLGHNIWLAFIFSPLAAIMLYFLYKRLNHKMQGISLDIIFSRHLSPAVGRFCALLFILCLAIISSYYLFSALGYWQIMIMPQTPFGIYCLLFWGLSRFISALGLEVLGRGLLIFVIGFAFIATVDSLFLISEMDFARFLPIITAKPAQIGLSAGAAMIFLFALSPIIFFIYPHIELKEGSKSAQMLFWGLLLPVGYFMLAALRNTAVFGDALIFSDFPTLEAVRIIEWGRGIARLELIALLSIESIAILAAVLISHIISRLINCLANGLSKYADSLGSLLVASLTFLWHQFSNYINNSWVLITFLICLITMLLIASISIIKFYKSDCQI